MRLNIYRKHKSNHVAKYCNSNTTTAQPLLLVDCLAHTLVIPLHLCCNGLHTHPTKHNTERL